MDLQWRDGDNEARFGAYVEGLSRVMGHADRVEPFRSYCTGLQRMSNMDQQQSNGGTVRVVRSLG